jgi:hypothetical protein
LDSSFRRLHPRDLPSLVDCPACHSLLPHFVLVVFWMASDCKKSAIGFVVVTGCENVCTTVAVLRRPLVHHDRLRLCPDPSVLDRATFDAVEIDNGHP